MSDLIKEFFKYKAIQEREELGTKTEKSFEERLEIVDSLDRLKIYTWEEELHQKVTHFQEKLYAYKLEWDDGDIDYCIENESGMGIGLRTNKEDMMYFNLNPPSKGITYIKSLHKILKDFVETKKEYRLRLLTGVTKVLIDKRLQEILFIEGK